MVKLIDQICRIFNQYYAAYLTNIPNLFMKFEMERKLNNFALLFETFSYLKFKNDVEKWPINNGCRASCFSSCSVIHHLRFAVFVGFIKATI